MGITVKKKICRQCGDLTYIWARGLCKSCDWKAGKNSGNGTTKIKPISDKRKEANVEYLRLRVEFLNAHQKCEVGIPGLCKSFACEVHHKGGRTGKLLTDINYFLAVCRPCHTYLENNPSFAKEQGFSVSRLDK